MIAISVIVPVYKAEKYLCRCIDSILMQTFKNFEVLLVDDGSPDRCGEICDEYARLDERIKVIHKENGGVSSARQCGIDNAKGEYTIHVDSDDWIEPNMLEELYQIAKAESADMVICDYYEENGKNTSCKKQEPTNCSSYQVIYDLFQQLHGSCCNKLIKSACYNKNSVCFPVGINIMEDKIFVIQTCFFMSKISYLNKAFYHYDRTNEESITHNSEILNKNLMAYNVMLDFYRSNHIVDKLLSKGLYIWGVRVLSSIALYGGCENRKIEYRNYIYLVPYIYRTRNLSWSHKLALCFRFLKLDFLVSVMLEYKKFKKNKI